MKNFALELIAHPTKMKKRLFTPIVVVDVAAVAMAKVGGEIIMMPMHIMQIMMQGLHEDMSAKPNAFVNMSEIKTTSKHGDFI